MIKNPTPTTNIPYKLNLATQTNNSDVLGDIWASKNIDTITNRGKLGVGDRLMLNTSDTSGYGQGSNVSGMGLPVAIKSIGTSSKICAIAGSKVLSTSVSYPSASFSVPTPNSGSLPTNLDQDKSDMEFLEISLYMTGNSTAVNKMDDIFNFSTITVTGSGGGKKMLCQFANRMYMSYNSTKIVSWDKNDTIATIGSQYTIDLVNSYLYEIVFMRATSNRIWIGTVNKVGGKGTIFEWDGSSNQPTKSYRLETQGALACVIKDDVPYVIDTIGNLLYWNGGTFKKLTGLYRVNNKLFTNAFQGDNVRFIHPNGIALVNGVIHFVLDTKNSSSTANTEETMPAGVYYYDEETKSIIHKTSFGYLDRGGQRTAGEDFGQAKLYQTGALAEMNLISTSSARNGTYLAGATVYTDATTTLNGIWFDDSNRTYQKAGSIITTKNYSPNVTDTWQSLYYRYRQLISSSDKIVVKYRTVEADPVEFTGTWTSTTTFTTTTDISSYWTSGTGGEIEVLQGIGAGRCSHITSIVNNSGTYTVTVDETYTGASNQTFKARAQTWIKLGLNIQGDKNPYFNNLQIPMSATTSWIQFKVWMLFTGRMELEDLQLQNKASQTANK